MKKDKADTPKKAAPKAKANAKAKVPENKTPAPEEKLHPFPPGHPVGLLIEALAGKMKGKALPGSGPLRGGVLFGSGPLSGPLADLLGGRMPNEDATNDEMNAALDRIAQEVYSQPTPKEGANVLLTVVMSLVGRASTKGWNNMLARVGDKCPASPECKCGKDASELFSLLNQFRKLSMERMGEAELAGLKIE